jgi:hypothetical protein
VHQLHDVHVIHVSYGTSAAVSWDVSVYLICFFCSSPLLSLPPALFLLCFAHWSTFAYLLGLNLESTCYLFDQVARSFLLCCSL